MHIYLPIYMNSNLGAWGEAWPIVLGGARKDYIRIPRESISVDGAGPQTILEPHASLFLVGGAKLDTIRTSRGSISVGVAGPQNKLEPHPSLFLSVARN